MQRKKIAVLGLATVLCVVGWASTPLYVIVVGFLDWRAYFVFPPIMGLLAWPLIYLYDDEKTLADVIDERIKSLRAKKLFLYLFKNLKLVAIILAALFLPTLLTPILVSLCFSGRKRVYALAIFLNIASTAFWIWIYLGGKAILLHYFNILKLGS